MFKINANLAQDGSILDSDSIYTYLTPRINDDDGDPVRILVTGLENVGFISSDVTSYKEVKFTIDRTKMTSKSGGEYQVGI